MAIENFLIDARSVVTVLSLATFIGIVVWSFSGRRAAAFAAAAQLPFADDADETALSHPANEPSTEKHHG